MSSLERPKLRPISPRRVEHQGQSFIALQDLTGAIQQSVLIPIDGFNHIVRHFDGQSTLIEIQGLVLAHRAFSCAERARGPGQPP